MKTSALILVVTLTAIFSVPSLAQEKGNKQVAEKTAEAHQVITPLRVQVTFNEVDGDKKVSSLPYTLLVNANHNGPLASIRMGLRVPISQGAGTGLTYLDMGTNIDGRAESQDDGRFLLSLSVERSSAYTPQPNATGMKGANPESPVIQLFRSQLNLLIRDGQTIQSTVSTDPLTGRVIKVDVTANVMK
jgi:hypothetical protein